MKTIHLILAFALCTGMTHAQSQTGSAQRICESSRPILDPSCFEGSSWSEIHLLYVEMDSVSTSICIRSAKSDSLRWTEPTVVYSSATSKRFPVGAVGWQIPRVVFWQEEAEGMSSIQWSRALESGWTAPRRVMPSGFSQTKPTAGEWSSYSSIVPLSWIENDSVVSATWSPESVFSIRRWKKLPGAHVDNLILSTEHGAPFLAWEEKTDSLQVVQYVFLRDTSSIRTLAYGETNWNPKKIWGAPALVWDVPTLDFVSIWSATFTPWFSSGNQLEIAPVVEERRGECMAGGGSFWPLISGVPSLRKMNGFSTYDFFSWRWRMGDSTAIVVFHQPIYPAPARKEFWSNDSLTLPITTPIVQKNDTLYSWTIWVQVRPGSWQLNSALTGILGWTGVGESKPPEIFHLSQNFPNPFNPTTKISYHAATRGFVTLKVFDLLGREIATLVNEAKTPGAYVATWDASTFPSGVYICRLQSEGFVQTTRMTLLK